MGANLDVGEFPEHGGADGENDDPQRIVKLTAHAVARIGDRFPMFRRFSRHMEGTEKRAGILSDAVAVLVSLYKRNPAAFENLGKQFASDLQTRRAATSKPNPTVGEV